MFTHRSHFVVSVAMCFSVFTVQTKDVWILIHGTFANKISRVAPRIRWWHPTDPFYKKLSKSTSPHGTIHAFTWSGSNIHSRRITAGKQLVSFIPTVAKPTDTIHIVAHSH